MYVHVCNLLLDSQVDTSCMYYEIVHDVPTNIILLCYLGVCKYYCTIILLIIYYA